MRVGAVGRLPVGILEVRSIVFALIMQCGLFGSDTRGWGLFAPLFISRNYLIPEEPFDRS